MTFGSTVVTPEVSASSAPGSIHRSGVTGEHRYYQILVMPDILPVSTPTASIRLSQPDIRRYPPSYDWNNNPAPHALRGRE